MAQFYSFLSDGFSFRSKEAVKRRLIYAPLCAPEGTGIKSAITPLLSGDIKIDKSRYLTKPASREDLRQPVRNFFVKTEGGIVSLADPVDIHAEVEIGQLWHQLSRVFPKAGVSLTARTFIPVSGENVELTCVTVKNVSNTALQISPVGAVPVFARSLSNKHDHEHVTALLNRVDQLPQGVIVEPSMRFNEEGHRPCTDVYYVFGVEGSGAYALGTFPTVESFLGEGGTFERPEAVLQDQEPRLLAENERQGKEVCGAIKFNTITLKPGEKKDYVIGIGIHTSRKEALADFDLFASGEKFELALEANKKFWAQKTSALLFDGGDAVFSSWMRWVTLQPVLRRIFGCSFLPDHDYGKGGKGWRDIWQDLLSLILIEPDGVRGQLLNNFAGVRIDGTNATIIGQKPGEFIADRNAITRVWMDHGAWPLLTTMLYIDQTGDEGFLFEEAPYFVDLQASRTLEKNTSWNAAYGNKLKDRAGNIYQGTVLEHLLIENLVQFFNVGEHNITRLESADWNDGLDMASKRGESVAFMSFYAGNLTLLADRLVDIAEHQGIRTIMIADEINILLDTLTTPIDYDDVRQKRALLFEHFCKSVQPEVSGVKAAITIEALAKDLRAKSTWMKAHIRKQEKVSLQENGETLSWFNGYYDNDGVRVEGKKNDRVWMTLTGQVFPLMHGVATKEDTADVVKAVRRFLKDKELGGYRLNTDFGLRHYLSFGRAFGFAYGTKENGAVFSHMSVMYSYALYKQGFAREGYEVLRSLYRMGMDMQRANIYPGVPEYFDGEGRGVYHFLTGSASWYVLTLLTMAYGVRGEKGDLLLAPQLVAEEFGSDNKTSVVFQFAGKRVEVSYMNPQRLDAGQYRIEKVLLNGSEIVIKHKSSGEALISRKLLSVVGGDVIIKAVLGA